MVSKQYFTALGEFVHRYSNAEALVHMGFHIVAGIPQGVANIMKKEASAGNLVSMLKAMIPNSDLTPAVRQDLLSCLQQLEVISEFRHRAIHRGATATEGGKFVADNVATMRSIEGLEQIEFSIEDIEVASDDLLRMGLRLMDAFFPATKVKNSAAFEAALHAPWRHKRVQPHMPHQPPRPARPSRKPQH